MSIDVKGSLDVMIHKAPTAILGPKEAALTSVLTYFLLSGALAADSVETPTVFGVRVAANPRRPTTGGVLVARCKRFVE